jgi:radical SAM protein with 4Fe4S-binding SPASM domain
MEMKFSLGDKVKDKITGYKGTITSVCFSINRPVSYLVEGIDTTGRPISDWVDEHRLKLDKVEKPIDNNKYNEISKEKLNDLKYVNAIKAAKKEKDKEEEEEEHDCKSCEFAPICMLLDILAKDKK